MIGWELEGPLLEALGEAANTGVPILLDCRVRACREPVERDGMCNEHDTLEVRSMSRPHQYVFQGRRIVLESQPWDDQEQGWHVALTSWAGLTRHPVAIVKVCKMRVRIRWLDTALNHTAGSGSLVPVRSLCRQQGGRWITWPDGQAVDRDLAVNTASAPVPAPPAQPAIVSRPCWSWCGRAGPASRCHPGSRFSSAPTFPCLACGRDPERPLERPCSPQLNLF